MVSKIGQRKFLLKHGYLESELDKMSPSEAKRIIASIEKIEHPQGQRKVYSEKEINAIKEFVEWYKKVLIKEHEDKVKQHEKAIMSKSFTDEAYCRGRVDEVRSLIDLLDKDLEKFLEE